MNSRIVIILFFCFLRLNAQEKKYPQKSDKLNRCSTVEHEAYLQKKYPQRMTNAGFENWLNPLVEKFKKKRSESGGIITIPVVVHVVHNGAVAGTAPNIDDQQVESQIEVLNNDFRKIIGTPGYNLNPVGVDTQIQFALAKVDQKGNPTNGIDRVYYNHDTWTMDEIEEVLKPQTVWNPSEYLNMWTVAFSDSSLLGYAQFPDANGLPGLDASGGLGTTDGVVSNYTYFGSRLIYPNGIYADVQYDKGRTMTHEVGHWFGLRHIWGDASCGDDYCADTPTAHAANYDCPAVVNCDNTGNEMVENYMDYTDDSCMNIFTQNQKDRMIVIINNADRRKTLKASIKNSPILLVSNDAEIKIEKVFVGITNKCTNDPRKITLTNRGTNDIKTASVNYNFNSSASKLMEWNGILKSNESVSFNIPETGLVGDVLNVEILNINGVSDGRISNNTDAVTIVNAVNPESFPYDEVSLKLQLDNKGSEITWNLTDSSGDVLLSGGPYEDNNPLLIEQSWQTKDGDCYTFTINDTGGDGLCCADGEGYFQIGTNDQLITNGGSFESNLVSSFAIEFLDDKIYLEQNPVHDTLVFVYGKNVGNMAHCEIFDISGKKIREFPAVKNAYKNEDVFDLQAGLYVLKVTTELKSKTVKFIKE
ncbi:M43 family zinc metalloprotease [Flavobacterium sp. H122]|uniref:M43 family zinc metalloprotease n=1 Tax=Flavobacterium sp. H122 TaxID=2529860 RepID=UPI0010AA70D1|nr:M43 family zinc metalloprotease [Flavobacterium sp. H122]